MSTDVWGHKRFVKRDQVQRFWEKVDHRADDECWEWRGCTSGGGYGYAWYGGRNSRAHRVSWVLHWGAIPEGSLVCHTCDNRICVNPAHLFLGTAADNQADMMAKGRGRCRGESHPRAKLTEVIVRQIRSDVRAGRSQRFLAEQYGVHTNTINQICRGHRWTHVK